MSNTKSVGHLFFMKAIIYIFLFFSFLAKSQSNCAYWSTYIGKTDADAVRGIAVDNVKNSYIIMQTNSQSLTITPGLISDTLKGFYDAYLAKFDSCGSFVWGTYLGTTGFDSGEKLVICNDGNIAFTGYSQAAGLPTTSLSCFQATFAGQTDGFIGKITPNGNLIWLTYFGKSNSDLVYDIACDFNGNLFIGGTTTSANLYTTTASFQQTFGGNTDAFIAKFGSTGNFKWCTYYGGMGVEDIHALTTDVFGNIFGSGGTNSFNLNTSAGCTQPAKDNGFDCYLIKLDSVGIRIFSTYLGGNSGDDCYGLTCDNSGNLYVGGQTTSTNFTITVGAYQPTLAGLQDLFLTKLSPNGNLLFSTFFGGSDNDATARLKFNNNQLYAFVTTASNNIPILGSPTYSTLVGFQNTAVVRFNTNGIPNYSTYFGSSNFGVDEAFDIEIKNNNLFLAGKTGSSYYPTSIGAFQPLYGTNDDGVLTRLSLNPTLLTALNEQTNLNEPTFYPNPANNVLFIKTTSNVLQNVQVFNAIGQQKQTKFILENQLDVSHLECGIYFLKINNFLYKFIKQ